VYLLSVRGYLLDYRSIARHISAARDKVRSQGLQAALVSAVRRWSYCLGMTPQAFGAAEAGWHDFFIAVTGASAALLGLLFVGVSINLGAIAAEERADLRARASQAFANLIFVLLIALLMLIPDPDPGSLAISLGVIAALGMIRVAQNLYPVLRERERFRDWPQPVRRIGWTLIGDLILVFTAVRIGLSADVAAIQNLATVVFVLLVGAADVAWSMLLEVSRERSG
jgi:hypothetical protein